MGWVGKIVTIGIFFTIIVQFSSSSYEWVNDDWTNDVLNPDFIDAMIWLQTNSPSPGIDPTKIYSKDEYEIPSNAYSIIIPWVYGYAAHYLTHLPVSTSGNREANGALVESLYGTRNQSYADEIIQTLRGRYIVISADFINDELPIYLLRGSQIPPIVDINDYIQFLTDINSQGEEVIYPEFYQNFYETLAVHLYLFDGNYVQGKYEIRESDQGSKSILVPPYDLEALHHFRLVYKSNTTIIPYIGPVQGSLKFFDMGSHSEQESKQNQIPRIKIFEYVNCAEVGREE